MARSFAYVVIATLVMSVLGEQNLRGRARPEGGALAIEEASHDSTDALKSSGRQGLLKLFKDIDVAPNDDRKALADVKEFGLFNNGEILITFLIWLPFYILLAAYYHSYVRFYAPPDATKEEIEVRNHYRDFQEFKSGLFGCSQYPGITFWSCCCPGLRWGDTVSKLDLHSYWGAFSLMTCLYIIGFIPLCTLPCYFAVVCYMTYHRQEFRKRFDFEEHGGTTIFTDCITYCCCMFCAVAQEARHTRDAEIANHPNILHETPRPVSA